MCHTKTSSVQLKIKGGTPPKKRNGRRKEGKKAKVNVGSQLDVHLRRVGLVCWGEGGETRVRRRRSKRRRKKRT